MRARAIRGCLLVCVLVVLWGCEDDASTEITSTDIQADTLASDLTDTPNDTQTTQPDAADASTSEDASPADAPDTSDTNADTSKPTDALEIPDIPIVIRPHRLDDTLRMNHLQAVGTHNSYHIQPAPETIPEWSYTHLPLDEQLETQGVRKLELDFYYGRQGYFEIYHLRGLDDQTTCLVFTDCLKIIKRWSDVHASHHPILVLLEPKLPISEANGAAHLQKLEAEILEVWPLERLVTPDLIQDQGGGSPDLRTAVETHGWPLLGDVRGRLMFVLHDTSGWRDVYLGPEGSTRGKVMFPEAGSDLTASFAAYHSINDPVGSLGTIQAALAAGHLVRTRADTAGAAPVPPDYGPLEAALVSGAHYISTDHPGVGDGEVYGASVPGGTPSRCNPVTAPAECVATDIEDPALR